jgi:hypothetical protein
MTLESFQDLEHPTHLLNRPDESLVLQKDGKTFFVWSNVSIFASSSSCTTNLLVFDANHFTSEDSEITKKRKLTSCDSSMLVKMYTVGSFRVLTQDISCRLSIRSVYAIALDPRFPHLYLVLGCLGNCSNASS